MGLLNKLLGYRWSLYVVRNGNELVYAMHENSVIRIVGYLMGYFAHGGRPVQPWSLHLNFNRRHQAFELRPEHFSADGENVSRLLLDAIAAMDPNWKQRGGQPVFVEAATKREIPIRHEVDWGNVKSEKDIPSGQTFYSVMREVFGAQAP